MKLWNIVIVSLLLICTCYTVADDYVIPNDLDVFDVWQYFDVSGIDTIEQRADALYFLTALQGIVNRDAPRLYLFAALALFDVELRHSYQGNHKEIPVTELDRFWFDYFSKNGYFKGRKINIINTLDGLIDKYSDRINGLVIWDMDVPATSNVALMAAGCEDLLPVSRDLGEGVFFNKVREAAPFLEVKLDLSGKFNGKRNIVVGDKAFPTTGSSKNDAYRYAIEKYMRTGIANQYKMWFNCDASMWGDFRSHYGFDEYGYLGDRNELQQNGMYNADYWVAHRAVFFDLTPWADCKPFDDPNQPLGTDNKTWHDIMEISYNHRKGEFGIVGGFVPWWIKYTAHKGEKYGDVETEWEFVSLLTSYNMGNDADAAFGIANASFFQHLPAISSEAAIFQEPEEIAYEEDVIYLSFVMMDYDGSAWLNQMVPSIYDDPMRGKLPLTWAINPALNFRVPHAVKYIYDNRTENDFLGFSSDGAAYIHPNSLFKRKGRIEESGKKQYIEFANKLNERYGIKYNVFYIDDIFEDQWLQMAAEITPRGFGVNLPMQPMLVKQTPVCSLQMFHIQQSPQLREKVLQLYRDSIEKHRYSPEFNMFRCILMTPSLICEAVEQAEGLYPDAKVRIVDAVNYFRLLTKRLENPTDTPFSSAEFVSAEPHSYNGLCSVSVSDGIYDIAEISGVDVWLVKGDGDSKYLYFRLDDGFRMQISDRIRISVKYFDDSDAVVMLQYNSSVKSLPFGGSYKNSEQSIQMENTGQWKTFDFILNDVSFDARQNGRSDFRLNNFSSKPISIASVVVSKNVTNSD